MAVKIRLRRQGRTNRPFFRLVVADSRSPRDGRYIETIGWYNPVEEAQERSLHVDAERMEFWLNQGAQPTENAEALVARAAPAVIRAWREKQIARRAKSAAKRKARKKA